MKTIQGDLIKLAKEGYFDVIVHGCNCRNIMGAGIAKLIKEEFPEAWQADCDADYYNNNYLGNISFAKSKQYDLIIFNAYVQYDTGGYTEPFTLDSEANRVVSIKRAFEKINVFTNIERRIGIPKIGAGLAGGDWSRIEPVIEEVMKNRDVTVVEYKP